VCRCKLGCGLNPPETFEEHEGLIRDLVRERFAADFTVDQVLYGVGPSVEITLDAGHGRLDEHRLVALAEELRVGNTRTEVLFAEILLSAKDRDEVGAGGSPADYDRPLTH
jgi:hypothetical protein